jgi:hypothetical protein
MTPFETVKNVFSDMADRFNQSSPINRLKSGQLEIKHYQALLRQIFHQARENPQIQALATVHFRGKQRLAIQGFYRHAISEIGHDQLALNDLAATGYDITNIPFENPLPATTAVTAFAFYQIYNRNPVGYLGYLFFLEFLPTSQGSCYIELLKNIGVPDNALTFLEDHTKIDLAHNKAMERYLDQLICTQGDVDAVIYALRATAYLYENMVQSAFGWVDNPIDYGLSPEEYEASVDRDIQVSK